MADTDAPSASVTQRAAVLQKAMDEVKKLRAKRQVNDALHTRNGPKIDAIHDLPLNSAVLVWREGNAGRTGSWNGPYTLLSIDSETCVVELPSGPTALRSTAVKPFYTQAESSEELEHERQQEATNKASNKATNEADNDTIEVAMPEARAAAAQAPAKRGRGRPRKHALPDITVFMQE